MIARPISRWLRPSARDGRKTSKILRMENLLKAMWPSANLPRLPRISRVLRNDFGLSRLPWNHCPACAGIRRGTAIADSNFSVLAEIGFANKSLEPDD